MTQADNQSAARNYLCRGMPRTIQEQTELEAFYPRLVHTDDIYAPAKERTRTRALKRLGACMVDGTSYIVTRQEEIRAVVDSDILGIFVVTITYVATMDTFLEEE
jgi:hypothetical protein